MTVKAESIANNQQQRAVAIIIKDGVNLAQVNQFIHGAPIKMSSFLLLQ